MKTLNLGTLLDIGSGGPGSGNSRGNPAEDPVGGVVGWIVDEIGSWLVPTLLGIMTALGILLFIYLGVKLATAEDDNKRRSIKAQMVMTIIAVFIVGMLIAIFQVIDWEAIAERQRGN